MMFMIIELLRQQPLNVKQQGRREEKMENGKSMVFSYEVLPDGNGGYEPCPPLLTENEAIRFLRLDKQKANPKNTLKHYRERGLLRASVIGKNLFYSRKSLVEFLDRLTSK